MSKDLYEVTVEGQYVTTERKTKKYIHTFVLNRLDRALAVIKKHLLDVKLREKYEDYKTYRTHAISATKRIGRQPDSSVLNMPLSRMTAQQLSDFCLLNALALDPADIPDIKLARERVAIAFEQKLKYEELDIQAEEKRREEKELLMLNSTQIGALPMQEAKHGPSRDPLVSMGLPGAPTPLADKDLDRHGSFVDDKVVPGKIVGIANEKDAAAKPVIVGDYGGLGDLG